MSKDNLMGLFETQEYISSESHEWDVPLDAKDKIERMVQKYNKRAIKMGYNDSILDFDASSLTLRGIFVPKTEKTSWLAKRLEDGRNAAAGGTKLRAGGDLLGAGWRRSIYQRQRAVLGGANAGRGPGGYRRGRGTDGFVPGLLMYENKKALYFTAI